MAGRLEVRAPPISLTSVVGYLSLMTAEKAPRDGSCRLYGCAVKDDRDAELGRR
jgi:hypothetical protein